MRAYSRGGDRSGFTLLEVLVASSATAALLLGVYQAMELSARQRLAGREQAACDQYAVGLLRWVEAEIAAAARPVAPASALRYDSAWSPYDAVEAKAAAETAADAWDGSRGRRPGVDSPRDWGIVGTQDVLLLPAAVERVDADSTLSVRGFGWLEAGELELPAVWQPRMARALSSSSFSSPTSVRRSRRPADGAAAFALQQEANVSRGRVPAWRVAGLRPLGKDVSRLAFRYFDGLDWWPEWDGRAGRLRAVEIELVTRSGATEQAYRLVVPLDGGETPR